MSDGDITRLLRAVAQGHEEAQERLVPLVQSRLHELARARMLRERGDHTLQPTALVNEAYIRLFGSTGAYQNRAHFLGAAAEAMRRVLVDHARQRSAQRRGGGMQAVTFHEMNVETDEPDVDILALDEALDALQEVDARLADVVRLRYFVGLTIPEIAEALGTSPATVKRDWTYARAWLFERMSDDE